MSIFSKSEKVINQVYFSPGNDCLDVIIEQLSSARSSIKICVFTVSDDRITRAILNAFRNKISIKIVTDNEKLFDQGSDIRQLAQTGISIRVDNTPNHMHHKFAIIDNRIILTGSYNWTRSAALYNHENLLVTSEKNLVAGFCGEFDKLWAGMTPFK